MAIWVTCTSSHAPMSTIAYMTPYDITTQAGGEAYPYYIQYGEVDLYSNIMPAGGEYRGWQWRGSTGTSAHTFTVQNEEHDVYVMWMGEVGVLDYSQGGQFVGYVDSGNPGPFYTP